MASRINWSRVLLGGLLAGLVINLGGFVVDGFLLRRRWETEMSAMGKSMEPEGAVLVILLTCGFLIGIVTLWIYAAIRAQYGPGPGAAAVAGLMAWLLGVALPNTYFAVSDFFSAGLLAASSAGALVYLLLAAMAGAWLYKPGGEVVAIEPGVAA
jgi:hypothetical protein